MNTEKNIREKILNCLNDKHMTQVELAIQSGIHESTISRILSGKRDILFSQALNRYQTTHIFCADDIQRGRSKR